MDCLLLCFFLFLKFPFFCLLVHENLFLLYNIEHWIFCHNNFIRAQCPFLENVFFSTNFYCKCLTICHIQTIFLFHWVSSGCDFLNWISSSQSHCSFKCIMSSCCSSTFYLNKSPFYCGLHFVYSYVFIDPASTAVHE